MKKQATTSAEVTANAGKMTATHNGKQVDAVNIHHRKADHFLEQYTGLVIGKGQVKEVVDLRIYHTNTTAYACLWVNAHPLYVSGSGKAGGYGYCKKSAAAGMAIHSAGFTLSQNINGCGEEAIREAVTAITELVANGKPVHVVRAHA